MRTWRGKCDEDIVGTFEGLPRVEGWIAGGSLVQTESVEMFGIK